MSWSGRDRNRSGGQHEKSEHDAGPMYTPGKRTGVESAYPMEVRAPLVSDQVPLARGGMLKDEFIEQLRAIAANAVDQELGAAGVSDACPYIEACISKYAARPAIALETLVYRWAPNARGATNAGHLLQAVGARIRHGVRAWRDTGLLPPDLAAADPTLAAMAISARPADTAASPGTGMSLASMEQQLGPGQQIDSGTATRMSQAVGADVSGARIHTGSAASAMAASVDAVAFAVGQNVVLGSDVPARGTLEMDALLAHELAHTAQQRDAAADPAARHKPIGREDAAAEQDAGAERLARLGTFAGQVGDVMRTGLQLQRCSSQKLPPGPPMAGKEADKAIASLEMVRSRIAKDLQRGVNAESRTHFYEDMESYAKAWFDHSPLISAIWQEGATSEQLDQMRWKEARQLASKGGGFTNYYDDTIHIYTKNSPAFVTIHELIHLHTANATYGIMGEHFVEGAADYYTDLACKLNKIPFVSTYEKEYLAIERLVTEVGEDAVADLVFNGNQTTIQEIVDSRGEGTWKRYKKALSKAQYSQAADILDGVKVANAEREEKQQRDLDSQNTQARERAKEKLEKEKESWPPEGTAPVSGRIIKFAVVDGSGRATVARGGTHGVRVGWTAHMTLTGGAPMQAVVTDVSTRTSEFALENHETVKAIVGDVELRPPQ